MKRISVYLKLRIIGAIDAMVGNSIVSRIIPHGQFFFSENTDSLIAALRSPLIRRRPAPCAQSLSVRPA